ncbi:MAG: hypothetical protein Q8R10_19430 [Pseudomonas sp.]|uniref:hypothetical protein n=1 Tax=Pseudomonas sp. TaxID=306 RepID=UPI002735F305|nr:hypothetical protein [Pseudomonas sp.]MDP3848596.1 hypothetical protein [Pseudomonas sp.]
MQTTTLSILAVIAIFAAIGLLYWGGYMSGRKDGTAEGYATGHSAGKSAAFAEAGECVRQYRNDAEQLKSLREIERRDHRTALEAIMLDCNERICLFARRANPFTTDDQAVLGAIASKLELAASTFDGLKSPEHARFARALQQNALNMIERLRIALEYSAAPPAHFEHPDTALIEWLDKEASYHGDLETGELRFLVTSPADGFEHVRDVLRLAIHQQQTHEAGQEVMA